MTHPEVRVGVRLRVIGFASVLFAGNAVFRGERVDSRQAHAVLLPNLLHGVPLSNLRIGELGGKMFVDVFFAVDGFALA